MITRHTADLVKDEMQKALEAIAKKHGLAIEYIGATLDNRDGYRPRFSFYAVDDAGVVKTPEFLRLKEAYPEIAGKCFEVGGKHGRVKIIGYKPRNYTYPIIFTDATGQAFKAPAWFLKNCVPENEVEHV